MICCCITWGDGPTITAFASAFFSLCIVFLTCRQARIQKENYQLSLFKERFNAVTPIYYAYSYFDGGIDHFIRDFIFESKDDFIPRKGYDILNELHSSKYSFIALFHKEDEFNQFVKDYYSLLGSARTMCQNLSKKPDGNDTMTLHYFLYKRENQEPIKEEELISNFASAKGYIEDFCIKQADFISRYSQFRKSLGSIIESNMPK